MKRNHIVCRGCKYFPDQGTFTDVCGLIQSQRMVAQYHERKKPSYNVVPQGCPRIMEQTILGQSRAHKWKRTGNNEPRK